MTNKEALSDDWDTIITGKKRFLTFNIQEILKYRDLLFLFVRRDFVAVYKQTILGPLWFFIQPILTTITFTVIFGKVANVSTDGMPRVVFYMAGIILWNYFAECLNRTSGTFTHNQGMFGKVYFPRLIVPLSIVINNLFKFLIQLLLFLGFYFFYLNFKDTDIQPQWQLVLVPVLILLAAGLGLGFGMVISSMTTKYRDLKFLIGFGVQLLMYASPVVYPLSIVPEESRWILVANPMTGIIETFKYAFLGSGIFNWWYLAYSFGFFVVILIFGTLVFNKVEKDFIDTV